MKLYIKISCVRSCVSANVRYERRRLFQWGKYLDRLHWLSFRFPYTFYIRLHVAMLLVYSEFASTT